MLGLDDQQLAALTRAHRAHLRDGDRPGAVRTAFWLGVHLTLQGEIGRATGWLGRAQRLLGHEGCRATCELARAREWTSP
jgi:hypothetical protein